MGGFGDGEEEGFMGHFYEKRRMTFTWASLHRDVDNEFAGKRICSCRAAMTVEFGKKEDSEADV